MARESNGTIKLDAGASDGVWEAFLIVADDTHDVEVHLAAAMAGD